MSTEEPQRETERVNWRLAVAIISAGVALIVGGLAIGRFDRTAYSSLLLNLGPAVALVAAAVIVEPRLRHRVRRAVEGAAAEVVDRATADIRERVERLEDLERAQLAERDSRRRAQDAAIERLLTEPVSPATIGELLAAAHDEGLFDGRRFHVRTSPRPDAHVLYMLPLQAANGVRIMWLDFQPIEDSGHLDAEFGIPLPTKGDATVMWINDQPASEIASALEAGLERLNEPLRDFRLAYALEQLAASVRVMHEARSAEADSPRRMRGSLRILINDRWAYTSFGLEAIHTTAAFGATDPGFRAGAGVWWPACVDDCERPSEEPEAPWREAIEWLGREGFEVLAPGEKQEHPIARFGRGSSR